MYMLLHTDLFRVFRQSVPGKTSQIQLRQLLLPLSGSGEIQMVQQRLFRLRDKSSLPFNKTTEKLFFDPAIFNNAKVRPENTRKVRRNAGGHLRDLV